MSGPHVSIDPHLVVELEIARQERWLDPDPLEPTDVDRAYALGFADAWDATKPAPPRRDRLGAVIAVAATVALLVVAFAAGRASAAPRSGQTTERVDLSAPSSAAQIGAPQAVAETAGRHDSTSRPVASRPLGGAPSPDVELGTAIAGGLIAYADPGLGDRYLAIPSGPGHRVRICAGSGTVSRCLERTSTDAGPALFEQRAGRIADVSFVDFQFLCECQPSTVGLIHGTVEWLTPGITPPPTDTRQLP